MTAMVLYCTAGEPRHPTRASQASQGQTGRHQVGTYYTAQQENPATLPEHLKLAKDKQDAIRLVLYCTAGESCHPT
jgi:hypothetical protein